jgi:Polyketide cyclase / dehydrase and lipid transport
MKQKTNRYLRIFLSKLTLTVGVFYLVGCASTIKPDNQTKKDTMAATEIAITREALIPGSQEAVFNFITAQDVLPKILTGYAFLPAVVGTSNISGPWDKPGSSRLVRLADGTTVREQVTEFSSPNHFAYKVSEFGNPILGKLATSARGEWTFSPEANGTRVRWTYTFTTKNALSTAPLYAITHLLWRGYMDVCLENSRRIMKTELTI